MTCTNVNVHACFYQYQDLFYLVAEDAGPAGLPGGRALASLKVQVLEVGHTLCVVRRRVKVVIHRHTHGEQVGLAVAGGQITARPRDILGLRGTSPSVAGAAAAAEVAPDQSQQEEYDEG